MTSDEKDREESAKRMQIRMVDAIFKEEYSDPEATPPPPEVVLSAVTHLLLTVLRICAPLCNPYTLAIEALTMSRDREVMKGTN